jgi:N-acyl-D-aspartate/D-glutamate deacylase
VLDLRIAGGTVVDGTGAAPRRADVGVRDGRIVAVGTVQEPARRTVDAEGAVVAPGFIDIHTHYDAQLLWDPTASPSPLHGVTTVIGGNCGFSIAPLGPDHVDYVQRMMARVEGIPEAALTATGTWEWTSFGQYLDRLEGAVAVNAGFLVGHSTLRRVVMGERATSAAATDDDVAAMVALAGRSADEGALGLSSSLGEAHTDGDGAPVPSRAAGAGEMLALAAEMRGHPGTTLEFIAALGEIPEDRIRLMADMSLAANRPLNWNLLGSLSPTEIVEQQLSATDHARARGAEVVALALPDVMRMRASAMFDSLPGWREVVGLPPAERRAALADPARRDQLRRAAARAADGGLGAMTRLELLEVADPGSSGPGDTTGGDANGGDGTGGADAALVGRTITELATERGEDPLDVLVDVVAGRRMALTLVFPTLFPSLGNSDEGWRRRVEVWRDSRVVLGGSDAGAHVDLMCHANFPTVVLGEVVRRRSLLSLEEAVRMCTDVPARLYGLRHRGRVAPGWVADLAVFDPSTVASEPARPRHDLPGGGMRLFAGAVGMAHVFVGGTEIVAAGEVTDARPGTVLRSGTHTETVTVPGG